MFSTARPDPEIEPSSVRVFFGEAGSTVRLDCSITPGEAVEQYYVTWKSAINETLVFYKSFPPRDDTAPFNLDDQRYFIDPRNFSLFIRDITPADETERYLCILAVEDPIIMMNYPYMRTENVILSLSIFSELLKCKYAGMLAQWLSSQSRAVGTSQASQAIA